MAVVIPESILAKVQMTGVDLLIDLACYMYEKQRLSFGKSKELSGLNYLEFQRELAKRKIDLHYDEEDLNTDLKNLGIEL
ncbi:MAG: UPF0175 family protein [Bacteroidota bacterium]